MNNLLELAGVSRNFGSLRAVDDISFTVRAGSRHAVIGPNGAGKSTLFDLIGGSLQAHAGEIRFDGRTVQAMPEHRRARLGFARTFQHSSVFLRLSVLENVLVGVARKHGVGGAFTRAALRRRKLVDRSVALLDMVGLAGRQADAAGSLSHGERRHLEIAMALTTEPRLLMLDEPVAGVSAAETARFTELIASLPRDLTLLLIEHDLDVVFELADTVTVLHLGRHLTTGSPQQVRADAEVNQAYLGAADSSDLFHDPPGTELVSGGPR